MLEWPLTWTFNSLSRTFNSHIKGLQEQLFEKLFFTEHSKEQIRMTVDDAEKLLQHLFLQAGQFWFIVIKRSKEFCRNLEDVDPRCCSENSGAKRLGSDSSNGGDDSDQCFWLCRFCAQRNLTGSTGKADGQRCIQHCLHLHHWAVPHHDQVTWLKGGMFWRSCEHDFSNFNMFLGTLV